MGDPTFERVREIYLEAADLAPEDRRAFLDRRCADDPEVRREVESLLEVEDPLPGTRGVEKIQRKLSELLDRKLPTPESIGPYRILGLLGEGGMGVVYRARHDTTDREVALKVMHPGVLRDDALRRFEYEVAVLGRLKDPGIAQIYDAGWESSPSGDLPYFAMELIEGSDLRDYSKAHSLSLEAKLRLFVRICEAVHHAHQQGIIHRDLKPGNIIVTASGVPKVLDFGIAKSTDADLQATQVTATGSVLGTLAYMSPEQASGDPSSVDTRSDVYSLGVILYEFLVGQMPYDVHKKMVHDAVRIIQEVDAVPLRSLDKQYRGDLDTVTAKAMAKEKERRYASAADLAQDLECFLNFEPVRARPATTLYQLGKFARRNRVLVGGVLATFLSLVAGVIASLNYSQEAKRSAHEAEVSALQAKKKEGEAIASLERAEREEQKARRAERRALSVSGLALLDDLEKNAEALWPCYPEQIPALEAWLRDAEELLSDVPTYEQDLEEIRSASDFRADRRLAWLEQRLNSMVVRLRSLRAEGGLLEDMQDRLARAQSIEEETIDAYADEWAEAIDEIEATYELLIEPQLGLVPLGPDPETELYEFWVWESGDLPEREFTETGESFLIVPETGMVLVLLPGGEFLMGATRQAGSPQLDPAAERD